MNTKLVFLNTSSFEYKTDSFEYKNLFIEGYLKDDELTCLNYGQKFEAVKADKLPLLSDIDIINN